jgi:hypothetical protein
VVVEWGEGVAGEDVYGRLDEAWWEALRDSSSKRKELFMRCVALAGPAMKGLEGDGQMEFWKESRNPVEVALQYVVRDVLQGVEKWVERLGGSEDCESFAEALSGAKLHRCYGKWRKKIAEEVVEDEGAAGSGAIKVSGSGIDGKAGVFWEAVATMDVVLWGAKQGRLREREVLRRLSVGSSNKGPVRSRLCQLVRECAI